MTEVNFDGLIGPTHHFAGLSFGNIASTSNEGLVSNPKKAALQGLHKMKLLHDFGVRQAVLPPVSRPDFKILHNLGFAGSEEQILKKLSEQAPQLISAFFSASSMWAANSATVSPSVDTEDGKVHITPANLISKFHRALESSQMTQILKAIFKDPQRFVVHDPLFSHPSFGDEGAANHTRFCESYEKPGLEFFVFGKKAFDKDSITSKIYPARQTLEACQAVARTHELHANRIVVAQQNPEAIDTGAFHNDVVAVGNESLLFYHEQAFLDEASVVEELRTKLAAISQTQLSCIRVSAKDISLEDAVKTYLFNSQIVKTANGETLLLAPIECQETPLVHEYLKSLVPSSLIQKLCFVDLRESMLNGGGPACLRLRVALTSQELRAVHSGVLLNDTLFDQLRLWIEKHYRDRLEQIDLCNMPFVREIQTALDELTELLQLGPVYPFQL